VHIGATCRIRLIASCRARRRWSLTPKITLLTATTAVGCNSYRFTAIIQVNLRKDFVVRSFTARIRLLTAVCVYYALGLYWVGLSLVAGVRDVTNVRVSLLTLLA